MNFQSCRNTSDAIPLYLPQQLYLKPIARMHITVQLPTIKTDNTVSNWEIMEKLRNMIKPDEFCILKVATSSVEFIRFEAEIEDRTKLKRVIEHLNENTIKLKGYVEILKVRAVETKLDFPSRHSWDSYFRDATNMDEMKPGERPDTVHISNLPIKWFLSKHSTKSLEDENAKPSENLFHRIFSKFGDIRYVDIPICDPYRSKMKAHMSGMQTFSFDQELFFEGYVQYRDYISFVRAMDAFRNMKLVRKEGEKAYAVNIKVDFDKTKHLSDASIRRRQIVRDRLVAREKEREEKEKKAMENEEKQKEVERQRELNAQQQKHQRQQEREERRKMQQLSRLKATESEEINKKIAIEEKKLLKAQRKLQAIRLTEELLRRIRVKKENELLKSKINNENPKDKKALDELEEKRLKLQKTVEERETIKKLLGLTTKTKNDSVSSDDGEKKKKKSKKKKKKEAKSEDEKDKSKSSPDIVQPPPVDTSFLPMNSNWYGYPPMYHPSAAPPVFGIPLQGPSTHPFPPRGRGFYPRRRGAYNPDYKHGWRGRGAGAHHINLSIPTPDDEYYRYFKKLSGYSNEHDDRDESRSKSRSRSHSRSKSRSRSRKRSRTRSDDELSESYPTSAGVYTGQNYKNYRGRGMRGYFPRRRGGFNPRYRGRGGFNPLSLVDVDPNYLEYLKKMAGYTETSTRSKSYSRSRSRSHRRRSYSRSRSRSKRRNRRSRSSSGSSRHRRSYHSRSRSRSRKRSRSRNRDSSRSRSKSKNHTKSKRSRSRSSRSKSKNHTKSKRSRSRSSSYKSIDSSKFISPSRLRIQKSRSKSWSLPPRRSKDNNDKQLERSWSKSPEDAGKE